jgi:uncharacterized damage-inducible protein DinB
MDTPNLYKITDITGYTYDIGRLVSMMNYARYTTLSTVHGLTTDELDYLHDNKSNSIGALLLHMAAVELGFQIEFFDKRKPNEQELKDWQAPYELSERGRNEIKGKPLEYYLEKLAKVRERTLNEFKSHDDKWLYKEVEWSGHPSNNYFIWFHVYEDEINHRGQIRWLRNRIL